MVGRTAEKQILNSALQSVQSELIAVYGRRRVGKTYLIREHYAKNTVFSITGIYNATLPEQIKAFYNCLLKTANKRKKWPEPTNWFEAFELLKQYLSALPPRKKVVFLDEFPWMCNAKSRFLIAFENFWNGWASARKDLVVVICGSATSWMLKNIERSKGGLYNRVTNRLFLQPFTLHETELFFKSKNIILSRKHITELYMMLGGIPHYLNQVQKGETPYKAISRLVMAKNGLLSNEFENLFQSLFGEGPHKLIIETLCKHRYGLKRDKLLALLQLESSGWFSNIIDDLVSSGFVEIQTPFGNKTKDALIKVKDNYCLFYINFKKKNQNAAIELQANTAHFKVWSGLSFENICFYHYAQIVGALGLSGIETSVYQWQHKGDATMQGAQIDMLIKRSDKAIQLCEIKFNEHPFVISKKYALEVRTKASVFNYFTKNKYSIFTTFICAGGLLPNKESNTLVHAIITLDNLFQY